MRKIFLLLTFLGFFTFLVLGLKSVQADDNQCSTTNDPAVLGKCIDDLSAALRASQNATAPLESQLNNLQKQVTGIENRVKAIEQDIIEKKKSIDEGYKNLVENKS